MDETGSGSKLCFLTKLIEAGYADERVNGCRFHTHINSWCIRVYDHCILSDNLDTTTSRDYSFISTGNCLEVLMFLKSHFL